MIPIDPAQAISNVSDKLKGGANLNDLLQQQIAVDNVLRSGSEMPTASLEDRCLDLQTGKVVADDTLSFDELSTDPEVDEVENIKSPESNAVLSENLTAQIKEETGWSDNVIDHIESEPQYEILKNADIRERVVAGKTCLNKEHSHIDPNYVDPKTGMTNYERMLNGRAAIDAKTGEKLELHHLGQDKDGPLVELCENSEHGDGNHHILHPSTENSWRHEPGALTNYERERFEHWHERAKEYLNEVF